MYVCIIGYGSTAGHLFLCVLNEQKSTTMPLSVSLMLKTVHFVKATTQPVLPVRTMWLPDDLGVFHNMYAKLFWLWCEQGTHQNVCCSGGARNYEDKTPHWWLCECVGRCCLTKNCAWRQKLGRQHLVAQYMRTLDFHGESKVPVTRSLSFSTARWGQHGGSISMPQCAPPPSCGGSGGQRGTLVGIGFLIVSVTSGGDTLQVST